MAPRLSRIGWSAVVLFAAAFTTGCSGSKEDSKTADDMDVAGSDAAPKWDSSSSDDDPVDDSSGDSGSDSSDDGSSNSSDVAEPAPKKRVQEDDYDMTYADCKVLARAYRNAWYRDEIEKLNTRKLPEKHFKKAEANVSIAADDGGANWLDACASTVGAPQLRSRLKCAARAKTLQRFNDCMDGKTE